ncbi:UNVERIFIED_CONTAM: Carbon catabolite repressor protein 44 [Sesamum radiatum]|uniref:Carbon catabolite repressor protein 44 n=1 Tax=Sesamum radiatum TaxID=300843 RepID=A0AAW2RWQ4_SESRA
MLRCSYLVLGLRVACCSKMSTTPGPLCRKFVPVEQREVTSISIHEKYLLSTLTSTLSQVESSFSSHLTILKSLEADFLYLQEVDDMIPSIRRTWRTLAMPASTPKEVGENVMDVGSFINKTELVIEEKIDYNDLVDTVENGKTPSTENDGVLDSGNKEEPKAGSELKDSQADCGDPNDPRVRLKRDCVGIMAAFRLKNPSSCHVIIANTRLYWDPEWADVKFVQAKYLLSRLTGFKDLVSDKFDCSPPIILAGDFNSVPGDQVH